MADSATVAAVAAGGSALILGCVQLCATAFWAGAMNQRVRSVEEKVRPVADLKADMATLVERIENLMDRLDAHDQAAGLSAAPRPRRRPLRGTSEGERQ